MEVAALAARPGAEPAAWVDLTQLTDPILVPDHVAAGLEARPAPGLDAVAALVATLRPRSLLLVLDNCEHLVEACAALAARLLAGCPSLSILTTSREPLGLPGERVWLVPPLSLPPATGRPSAAALAISEAMQLFAERAREANPRFHITDDNAAAVAAVCRRLDGLPLALELAAARTRVLSVEQISERLDDAFQLLTQGGRTSLPRQKTLRGTIDWSYSLLTAREQILLRRLTIFAGSFSLEAVEAICPGEGLAADEVLDATSALVDRSLVVVDLVEGEARYRLLETVRQYGREHLRSSGEEGLLRQRHAAHFTLVAESLAPALFGGNGPPALMRRLDAEHDNFRAAADWALSDEGDAEVALRLVTAIHWYWFARGLLAEAWRRTGQTLEQSEGAAPGLRARAQIALGVIAFWVGRPGESLPRLHEAVDELRREGDPTALSYGLTTLGANLPLADADEALALLAEAMVTVAALPETVLTVFVAYWQGRVALASGDRARARPALEGGVVVARRLGHGPAIGHSLFALAELEKEEGRLDVARKLLAEGVAVHLAIGDRWGLVQDLRLLAPLAAARDEARQAARLVGWGRHLAGELGITATAEEEAEDEALERSLRACIGDAEFERAEQEGREQGPAGTLSAVRPPEVAPDLCCGDTATLVQLSPPTRERVAVTAPARLEVSALGPFEIRSPDGSPADPGWSSARTRELLVFLLLHADGASKEEIGLALWPEASAAQVRNSFHVTLHRLRSALGHAEWVRAEGGRYLLDPAAPLSFDARRFETLAQGSLKALGRDPGALRRLLEALDLYRGALLADEPASEWHEPQRDRLERLYLDSLAAAGRALEEAGRPADGAGVYRRWIEADDLAEPAYRGLMRCLEAAGERAEALKVYRRLATLLERELDVEPEAETVALFERLQGFPRTA